MKENKYLADFVNGLDEAIGILIKDEKFYSCIKALLILISLKINDKKSCELLEKAHKLINGICGNAQNRLDAYCSEKDCLRTDVIINGTPIFIINDTLTVSDDLIKFKIYLTMSEVDFFDTLEKYQGDLSVIIKSYYVYEQDKSFEKCFQNMRFVSNVLLNGNGECEIILSR